MADVAPSAVPPSLAAAGLAPWDALPDELREETSFMPWPADEYQAIRVLAHAPANSGVVFECVHVPTGARCVVKRMPNSSVMAGARTEDAKVDIGVSSFLEKNRSPFVDFGRNLAASSLAYQDERSTYFVSELFSGGELFGHVSERRFDEVTARKYARQVIEGVASLHACGIAHRDISLENLVLGADDEVRIIDFGLAVPIYNAGFAQEMYRGAVGKKFYRAPEMYPREDDDIRVSGLYEARPVDAWAVGVALLIMVMGSPPWEMARRDDKNFRYFLRNGLEKHVAKLVGKEGLLSSELLDLLKGLLMENPLERMTIEAARVHPWLQIA